MKNTAIPKNLNIRKVFIDVLMDFGGKIVLGSILVIPIIYTLTLVITNAFGDIFGFLFFIATPTFLLFLAFINSYHKFSAALVKKRYDHYTYAVSTAYRWSIKEALKTEYPHGVVYILENILQELDKF